MPEKLKILVVDDNREFCQNLSDILELKGYETATSHDGSEALEMVKQNDYNLVLMDIKMPVMNGVESFKKIKEISPDIQVIMVTAFAVEELIREALREGAFGFLRKPLDFDEFFELIEQATAANGVMILVADDDENFCANMKDILSDKGYRVSTARDGNTAIEKTRKNNFDIILIDMKMPALNGLETYLAIRDIRPDVVAVIITGYRQEMSKQAEQAVKRGAYTCLEKPIDMDKLVLLLERIMKQKYKGCIKKPE